MCMMSTKVRMTSTFWAAVGMCALPEEENNMHWIGRRVVPVVLVGSLAVIVSTRLRGWQLSPVTVTRLFTGSDGQTHAENVEIGLTPSAIYSEALASEPVKASEAQFFRLPKGKVQDWHNPARRQYVVTLSGRGEVEIAEGQRIPLNPGRVVLLENVTGKGHITRSFGSEDLTFFIVPLSAQ
jgi:quercetin dioxygenase-like cupin family protein